jgi:hypothetical protein
MIILGDLRAEIAKETQRMVLLKILDKFKYKESYYIFITEEKQANPQIIKTKILILDRKPPKMLGSCLYFVDNKLGIFEPVWELPFDYDLDVELSDKVVEPILKSAKGMPILNS